MVVMIFDLFFQILPQRIVWPIQQTLLKGSRINLTRSSSSLISLRTLLNIVMQECLGPPGARLDNACCTWTLTIQLPLGGSDVHSLAAYSFIGIRVTVYMLPMPFYTLSAILALLLVLCVRLWLTRHFVLLP